MHEKVSRSQGGRKGLAGATGGSAGWAKRAAGRVVLAPEALGSGPVARDGSG